MVIALALAGGTTYLVYRRLRLSAAHPQLTQIVAAAQAVQVGVALTPKDVKLIDWPLSVPLTGTYTKIDDVVGRPLIYPVSAGEPVLDRDLAKPGSGIGLSVKIPAGMRGTSVKSNEIVGVAGFLFPGSHVDVLATFQLPGNPNPVTQTILQNVEVLTAGTRVEPDPQGKPEKVSVVTLLLNPEDSQKLLMASTHGTIQFVLRNGIDGNKAVVTPTTLNQLVAGAEPPPAPHVSRVRRRIDPPKPKPPSVFAVEVIEGTKSTVAKF